MAVLFRTEQVTVEDNNAEIRRIKDGPYVIAIGLNVDKGDDEITEICLTEDECRQITDLIYNK